MITTQEILLALLGGVIGSIICYTAELVWARRHDPQPYKWACPQEGCGFRIQANQQEFVLTMAERHEMRHQE